MILPLVGSLCFAGFLFANYKMLKEDNKMQQIAKILVFPSQSKATLVRELKREKPPFTKQELAWFRGPIKGDSNE